MSEADPAPTTSVQVAAEPGVALVVDDDRTNRLILKALLENQGYRVEMAGDGRQAIDAFRAEQPHLILMDIMMPVMDGYEAVRRIRGLQGDAFVPIICLTALDDKDSFVKCIQSGADDFMGKPFDAVVLQTKIQAMERIRLLHQEVRDLMASKQREEEVAVEVFKSAVTGNNVQLDIIQWALQPASEFSGDLLLSEFSPSGDLHIMLGDFTGHGMAAALGALPTSEVFRAMTRKGFQAPEILTGINQKLHGMLPTGIFLAVQFVTLHRDPGHVSLCNLGMPDILLVDTRDGSVTRRFPSTCIPLAIKRDISPGLHMRHLQVASSDSLLLVTDGVTEAISPANEAFGDERLSAALKGASSDGSLVERLLAALAGHCQGREQPDDISVAEVPCHPSILKNTHHRQSSEPKSQSPADRGIQDWDFQFTVHGDRLNSSDPVPMLMNQLQELEDIDEQRSALFTLLTELYVNALDHGVLGLSSEMKRDPAGFMAYFEKRETMLRELKDGFVRFSMELCRNGSERQLEIRIEDSGIGFDPDSLVGADGKQLSGRGLVIVRELCESLHIDPPGNVIRAIYGWRNDL